MTKKRNLENVMQKILSDNPQYTVEAYQFVIESLEYTLKKLKQHRHVNGTELLEGIRKHGLEQFGPMTKTVFNHWGIQTCQDFGRIVFNLVESGLLRKSNEDSMEDFNDGYDFTEVFEVPFYN